MDEIRRYNEWISNIFKRLPFAGKFNFREKESNISLHALYMLMRTQSMFEYSGLPETIPQRVLELFLQINGNVCFNRVDGELYIFTGGLGGEPDVYYRPTIYTIANPALNYSAQLKIGADCEIMLNDSLAVGLMPLFNRYASMLAENELSIYLAVINSRIIDLIAASDDNTKESAEHYLEEIEKGELGIIASNAFLDGLKTQPYGTTGHSNQITQLIENEQYLKAAWYNDLGLNANYNMKREALSTAESQLNDDALLPLVDDLLRCRQIGLERVNAMFDTNISVRLASSWEDNIKELEAQQDNLADPEAPEDPKDQEAPEDDTEKEESENAENQ